MTIPSAPPSLRRQPIYLQLADRVREAIFAGQFPPGTPLPTERDLAESFGASRASIREALRALQAEGLVTAGRGAPTRAVVADSLDRPARAALVNLLRLERVRLSELVELRCLLESAAVRWAAERADPARIEEAQNALRDMHRCDISAAEFDDADVRFHVALARASGNEAMHLMMLALRDPVADHLLSALVRVHDLGPTLQALTAEHAAILDAVIAGDGAAAAHLVTRHIESFYPTKD